MTVKPEVFLYLAVYRREPQTIRPGETSLAFIEGQNEFDAQHKAAAAYVADPITGRVNIQAYNDALKHIKVSSVINGNFIRIGH